MINTRPSVLVCGRPNVGKSTLFNRITRKRAITSDIPGTTQDLLYATVMLEGKSINIIDSPGWLEGYNTIPQGDLNNLLLKLIPYVNLVLLVVDVKEGITNQDVAFANLLRKLSVKVKVVANKGESSKRLWDALEVAELGFGIPWVVSAAHGDGCDLMMIEVFDEVEKIIEGKWNDTVQKSKHDISMTIVGFPNAGKSTLVNALLGEELQLVGAGAGSTRDAGEHYFNWKDKTFKIVDTAGARKRAKITEFLEKEAIKQATFAIRRAELAVLVVDCSRLDERSLPRQERNLISYCLKEGRAILLAFNKVDLIDEDHLAFLREKIFPHLASGFAEHGSIPWVTISAKDDKNFGNLLARVASIHESWCRRISTSILNQLLVDLVNENPPNSVGGLVAKPKYITQVKARPPLFSLFCSRKEILSTSWQRYLINNIRKKFNWEGVPIRLQLKSGKNPYVNS